MEALTRLVAESLARHGFDRPVDYRRLQWSRWFRCDSVHSLLYVPSKPGVFALAEEVVPLRGASEPQGHHPEQREGSPDRISDPAGASTYRLGRAGAIDVPTPRRMLAVLQFGEDDDMAYVLDRMFSRQNPMRTRLASGRCYVRFVVIEDETHRRSIATALNQWLVSSGEKAAGIGAHFASSLELTPATGTNRVDQVPGDAEARVGRTLLSINTDRAVQPAAKTSVPNPALDSGSNANIHCPSPLPSGF